MKLVKNHPDNGDSLLAIELGDRTTLLAPGTWTLEIVSVAVRDRGVIHAWIERSGHRVEFVNFASYEMTLSIPGTATHVITVGAVDAADPIFAGDFSSFGPTRDGREKPDVSAPGVNVIAAKAGTRSGVVAMSGTSMAAPHVTGAVALA